LYKFVKVFKYVSPNSINFVSSSGSDTVNNLNSVKFYETNTSLYQNQEVFELLNFKNWTDGQSLLQNPIISDIILLVTENSSNSFFNNFSYFSAYCINCYPDVLNFKLQDGTPVLYYFTNINNINDLDNHLFNILTECYSPLHIYNTIINITNIDNLFHFELDEDNLKKKIIIYLFVLYLIFINLSNLLIRDLSFNSDLYIEYTFPTEIVNIKLSDVISSSTNLFNSDEKLSTINLNLLKYFISVNYNIDVNNPNSAFYGIPDYYKDNTTVTAIIKTATSLCTNYLPLLIKKYISSYNLIIGNENFRTTTLLENNNLNNFTYSNLLKNINIIYNNDSNSNNVNNYNLTIDTIATINVYNNSLIYDMNNTLYKIL
jgi:hypothetical protein